jgi:hypothetical protein
LVPQSFGMYLAQQLERDLLFSARRLVRRRDAHRPHALMLAGPRIRQISRNANG